MLAASEVQPVASRSNAALADDRRTSPRVECRLPVAVRGSGCGEEIGCTARNVNEGGLFLYMSPTRALNLGERCEVVLSPSEQLPELSGWVGVPVYATVIRTEAGHGGTLELGVGLRFDQPLVF